MIVKSATGPVDLSRPENVRRWMVFQSRRGGSVTFISDGDGMFGHEIRAGFYVAFLGMDPAHAERADCERFGIAPGLDAAAHGFARTRDGFAVDLRRAAPVGTVYEDASGERHTRASSDPLYAGSRFLGLDSRHARPEDMERLCCCYRDPRGYLCSLALGEHEQHEDIAAGVKWAAETEPLAFHSGPTCGGTVAITVNGKTETVRYERETPTEKMEQAFREAAARASEQGDKMTSARVRGLRSAEAAGTMSRADRIPAEVAITGDLVAARAWTADGDKVWSPGKASGLWCGSVRKETGQACPNAPAIRPRVVVQGDVATLTGLRMGTVHFDGDKVRVWTYDGDKIREMAPSEYDVVRVGPCAAAPDFKVSTAWMDGDTESVQGIDGVLGFTWTGGTTNHITLASADGPTWPPPSTAIPAPGTESSLNLSPQALALRSAMATIDALPWPAADKRALRDAAHAVAEMVEATDGKAPARLRGPVTEMLAALATAAHVGPAVVKDAELARGAAALMMPKRRKK